MKTAVSIPDDTFEKSERLARKLGLRLVRRAGPFRRVRTFDRGAIRRVRLRRRDNALVLDTSAGVQVLTTFGTIAERAAIRPLGVADAFGAQLGDYACHRSAVLVQFHGRSWDLCY